MIVVSVRSKVDGIEVDEVVTVVIVGSGIVVELRLVFGVHSVSLEETSVVVRFGGAGDTRVHSTSY